MGMDALEQTGEPQWLDAQERQAWLTLGSVLLQLGPCSTRNWAGTPG